MQKKKNITLAGKVTEVRLQRDLFAQLLCISLEKELAIDKVLMYPLTPVPFSMCHIDGTICKTNKSTTLLKILEHYSDNEVPQHTDIVYDGFFIFHCMKEIPMTFGNISKKF